jgi:hypothetical protein
MNKIIKLFIPNKTKWIVLGRYTWEGYSDFLVFARGNKKSRMLEFKTKRVNLSHTSCVRAILPNDLLDVKANWESLINELNENNQ